MIPTGDEHVTPHVKPSKVPPATTESRLAWAVDEIHALNKRLTRLGALTAAMWQLLRKRTDLTEDDISTCAKHVLEAAGSAGTIEGKGQIKCSQCGRVISRRHEKCLYCGAKRSTELTFDDIL